MLYIGAQGLQLPPLTLPQPPPPLPLLRLPPPELSATADAAAIGVADPAAAPDAHTAPYLTPTHTPTS